MDRIDSSYTQLHSYAPSVRSKRRREGNVCPPRCDRPAARSTADENDALSRAERSLDGIKARLQDNDYINEKIARAAAWLEVDEKELRIEGERKKMPIPLMTAIAGLSLSLLLIVAGSVIKSGAAMEVYSAQNEVERLEAKLLELEHEIELKNDLRYIEEVARTKLGMVDGEHATVRYLSAEKEDKVEIYENSDNNSPMSALLNALGILDS